MATPTSTTAAVSIHPTVAADHGWTAYQHRTATETLRVRTGFVTGFALSLVLWAVLAAVLTLLVR